MLCYSGVFVLTREPSLHVFASEAGIGVHALVSVATADLNGGGLSRKQPEDVVRQQNGSSLRSLYWHNPPTCVGIP